LEKLVCAKYATFDAYGSEGSGCYGETRKEILKEIEDWAEDQDGKCIFWLSGVAWLAVENPLSPVQLLDDLKRKGNL
jgi:hypothetical protein